MAAERGQGVTKILWRYRDVEAAARGGAIPGWLAYAISVIAVADFVSFIAGTWYFGGDALNGHQAAGHYFLSNKGQLTEVSRAIFEYSRWHALSLFVTFPPAMLMGWYLSKRQGRSDLR
jgi:hypothetical protein